MQCLAIESKPPSGALQWPRLCVGAENSESTADSFSAIQFQLRRQPNISITHTSGTRSPGKTCPATAAMDNGSDDRVYAAEKIIQKRVKKVRTSIPQLRAPRYKCFPLPGQGRVPGKMEGVEPKVQHMGAGGKHSRHAAHRDLRGLTGGNRRTKQEARPEEQEGEDGSVECCCCGCCRRGA